MLQLVTPHILRRRTTSTYTHSSSDVKATVEYFLKSTARDRNLCQAGGVVVPNQNVGGRGGGQGRGGGRGRVGRGGQDGGGDDRGQDGGGVVRGDIENLFPHSANCARTRRCRGCLNLIQGEGYERERLRLANQTQQCQHCQDAICKNHRRIVCIPCSNKFLINENNNEIDFEMD